MKNNATIVRKMAPHSTTKIIVILLVSLSSIVNADFEPGSRPPRIFKIGSTATIKNHHVILKEGKKK